MLHCENLHVSYGRIEVLHGITLNVEPGETVALLGANGAGKTTLLRTISGLLRPHTGEIRFDGEPLDRVPVEARVAKGIAHVPEGRRIFPGLTVRENLEVAASAARRTGKSSLEEDLDFVMSLFPRLRERSNQLGWSLSGGEQQMLAIGRALMARPRLLLLDEPSLGLAPVIAEEVYEQIEAISRQGVTVLLVEQNTVLALSVAQRGYVLENGYIALSGNAEDLLKNPRVRQAYLGA